MSNTTTSLSQEKVIDFIEEELESLSIEKGRKDADLDRIRGAESAYQSMREFASRLPHSTHTNSEG